MNNLNETARRYLYAVNEQRGRTYNMEKFVPQRRLRLKPGRNRGTRPDAIGLRLMPNRSQGGAFVNTNVPDFAAGAGLGDVWDDVMAAGKPLLATVEEKGQKLENALKLIIGLSGVAALTGVISLIRR